MTRPSLVNIEERAAAATEGPWADEDCEGELSVRAGTALTQWKTLPSGTPMGTPASSWKATDLIAKWDLDSWDWGEDADDDQRRQNAEFMAYARTDVPALTAVVRDVLAVADQLDRLAARHPDSETGRVEAAAAHEIRAAITKRIDTTPKE